MKQKRIISTNLGDLTVYIKERSILAKFAAWKLNASQVAIVTGNTIHLHNTSSEEFFASVKWVRHELCHVMQFRKYGFVNFIFLYLLESVRKGYFNNRFEVEARKAEQSDQVSHSTSP